MAYTESVLMMYVENRANWCVLGIRLKSFSKK